MGRGRPGLAVEIPREHLENAMACLAGLNDICKLLLLRVGQIETRTTLNGLVSPMEEEIIEIMQGIMGAQAAHSRLWKFIKK